MVVPKEMVLLPATYSAVSSGDGAGVQGYKPRERSKEALTCKLMGRPASSRVGSSQERLFCLLAYKQRRAMALNG